MTYLARIDIFTRSHLHIFCNCILCQVVNPGTSIGSRLGYINLYCSYIVLYQHNC